MRGKVYSSQQSQNNYTKTYQKRAMGKLKKPTFCIWKISQDWKIRFFIIKYMNKEEFGPYFTNLVAFHVALSFVSLCHSFQFNIGLRSHSIESA